MPQERAPYMWSVVDWRTDELYLLLDNREQGIYRNLIDESWNNGSIPSDPAQLALLSREPLDYFLSVWAKIHSKFIETEGVGRLVSRRSLKDKTRLQQIRASRKRASKIANKARWGAQENKGDNPRRIRGGLPNRPQTQKQEPLERESTSPLQDSPKAINRTLFGALPAAEKRAGRPRPRNEAFDRFIAKFAECMGSAYVPRTSSRDGDFVQLAILRQTNGWATMETPPDWEAAMTNYFASPKKRYTLADLCVDYSTYRNSAIDRYGVPIDHEGAKNGQSLTTGEFNAREAAKLSDLDPKNRIRGEREN